MMVYRNIMNWNELRLNVKVMIKFMYNIDVEIYLLMFKEID